MALDETGGAGVRKLKAVLQGTEDWSTGVSAVSSAIIGLSRSAVP